jgi:hypothetical protein
MKKAFIILSALVLLYVVLVIASKPTVVSYLKKKIEHSTPDSQISGASVDLNYSPWSLLCLKASGAILINSFKHDKFKAQNIKVHFKWARSQIYLGPIEAKVLEGTVNGDGTIQLGNPLNYVLKLNFANLDLSRFVEDFELKDKFLLVGLLNGKITLSGAGKNFRILNGDFSPPVNGGDLTISDTQFLKNMAVSSKLPSDLVVDSFKNYHYNTGQVQMFLEHGDLNFNVSLEGVSGKRELKVVVHDFNLN